MSDNSPLFPSAPTCCCSGGGKPVVINGEAYIFRSPSCRVHPSTYIYMPEAVTAENTEENWTRREGA